MKKWLQWNFWKKSKIRIRRYCVIATVEEVVKVEFLKKSKIRIRRYWVIATGEEVVKVEFFKLDSLLRRLSSHNKR